MPVFAGQGDPARNDALDLNMIAGCEGELWLTSAYAQKVWTVDPADGTTVRMFVVLPPGPRTAL